MAGTDGSVSPCDGQVLAATSNTSCQGVDHKVSGEPTPHDMGMLLFGSNPCSSPHQISPTARDLCGPCTWGAGASEA